MAPTNESSGREPPARRVRLPCSLPQKLLEIGHRVFPLADAELVGNDAPVLDDQEARRTGLARDLVEHGVQLAWPVAVLVGLLELGRFDLDPGDAAELGRGEP